MTELPIVIRKDRFTTSTCYTVGNKKVGSDTAIFNFCSSHECPSKKLGLCQLANTNRCYRYRMELLHPQIKTRSNRQGDMIRNDPISFAVDLMNLQGFKHFDIVSKKNNTIKYVRFSEGGDFRDQNDVSFLYKLAEFFPELTFYGYTARSDLSFYPKPSNVVINGSGFMLDNRVDVITEGKATCGGDCRKCVQCKSAKGRQIKIMMH